MTYKSQYFQGAVRELKLAAEPCLDLQRVADPYFKAADWESISGLSIVQAVGPNSAVDMHAAVDRLTSYQADCVNCGATACIFAGVEKMTSDEILTLVEG